MYYDNGIEALRGVIKAVEAEQKYLTEQLRKALVEVNDGGREMCYADAHELCAESIMQLQHELEAIRLSAKRKYNTPF